MELDLNRLEPLLVGRVERVVIECTSYQSTPDTSLTSVTERRELELVGDVGRGVKVDGGRLDPRMVRRATDAYRTGYVLAFDRY